MDTVRAEQVATAPERLVAVTPRRAAVAVLGTLLVTWVSLTSFTVTRQMPEIWFCAAAGFFCLTSVWDVRRRAPYRALVLVGLALFVTFAVEAVLTGQPVLDAARLSAGNLAQSLLFTVLYRRTVTDSWAPRSSRQLIGLLYSALVAAAAVLLIGAAPGVSLWTSAPQVWGWWVLRNLVSCFVGAMCLSVLFDQRPDVAVLRRAPWLVVGLSAVSVACVILAFADPTQPLSWVLLVPAVWSGMALRPWGTALTTLLIGLGAALETLLPGNQFGYTDSVLPPACLMDLLITVGAFVAQLLALTREHSADLTEQITHQREAARDQAHVLDSMFQSLDDGVVIVDDHGRITRHNAAAPRLLAVEAALLRTKGWLRKVGLRRLDGSAIDDLDLAELGTDDLPVTFRIVVRNDHTPVGGTTLEVTGTPIDVHGEHHTLLLFHDVTQDQHRLDELKEFARVVAHDLRGPLSGVLGWMEMSQEAAEEIAVADDASPAERRAQVGSVVEMMDRALVTGRRLDEVIEGWLGYMVTRSGSMRTAQLQLAGVAEEVAHTYAGAGADSGTTLGGPVITVAADDVVRADPTLLRQVLANLVGNSLKYSRPGQRPRVTIASVRIEDIVTVTVSDNGIGIPLGTETQLFEEGWRADQSRATHRGNGLGLALCRQIVERHGGQIRASRNSRGGTSIIFTLPAGE